MLLLAASAASIVYANRFLHTPLNVPEGGYAQVIHRLFVERVQHRLGTRIPDATLNQLFAFPDGDALPSIYDWEGLFAEEYGV